LKKAVATYEDLCRDYPAQPQFAVRLGASYCNLGTFLKEQNDPTAALDWYGKAMVVLERVQPPASETSDAKRFLRNAHWGRGEALTLLNRHEEAMADFDRAAALASGAGRTMMQLQRAGSLARMGRHAQAVAHAEPIVQQSPPAGVLYNSACVYALASAAAARDTQLAEAERTRLAEQYAARAVELLTQVHAAGFFKRPAMIEHLEQDVDLDSLRSREDYRQLLGQIKQVKE
jgi:tetratricopeptide (TPR) repeat protein